MRCYGYYRDHSLANVQQAYLLENMHVYRPVTCIQHIIQIIYSFNIVTAQPGKLLVTLTGCGGCCSSRDGCTDVGLRSCVGTEF